MTESAILKAALSYVDDDGVPVFPWRTVGGEKKPLVKGGHNAASRDPAQIREWLQRWPDAGIAMPNGILSGFLTSDIDRHNGQDGGITLDYYRLPLDGACLADTPRNGRHAHWRAEGHMLDRLAGDNTPLANIDLLGEGGWVALPSPGNTYRFINGSLRDAAPIPEEWLRFWIKPPKSVVELGRECKILAVQPEPGRRNMLRDIAFKWAFRAAAGKLDEQLLRDRLWIAALATGLDHVEIGKTIDDGIADAKGKAGSSSPGRTGKGKPAPAEIIAEIEPWDEEVDGGVAVNEAVATLRRHVLMTRAERMVTALWALHTHLVDAGFHSPRLNVFSPIKRCGKSTLRRIIAGFVAKPVLGENLSAAVIYHVADAHRPTFLFDEIHLLLSHRNRDRPTLYSLMTAGYERTGATWRMQGEGTAMAAKPFRTYSPMLLAGIGRVGGSLGDRCIPIKLKRKLKDEAVEVFDFDADQAGLVVTGRKFARWAIDNADEVRATKLGKDKFPAGWDDRQCDCARPLLKIALVLGEAWFEAVRNALAEVWRAASGADLDEDDNLSAALLADIEIVFDDLHFEHQRAAALAPESTAHVSSARLVELLTSDPEKPWAALGRMQKPLTQNRLARMLRPYGISPQEVGPETARVRGYLWRQFVDVWRRYA